MTNKPIYLFRGCCHIFHWNCYDNWTVTVYTKMQGMDKVVLYCPLCKQICNAFLPIHPSKLLPGHQAFIFVLYDELISQMDLDNISKESYLLRAIIDSVFYNFQKIDNLTPNNSIGTQSLIYSDLLKLFEFYRGEKKDFKIGRAPV